VSRPPEDPYQSYVRRSSRVIAALTAFGVYFQQQSTGWKSDECGPLLAKANEIAKEWTLSLDPKEEIYPSADAIREAVADLQKVPEWVALMETNEAEARQEKDVDSVAVLSRYALRAVESALQGVDAAKSKTEAGRRLLMTREGTVPALPPPPPPQQ